jgi:hypothetical protein
MISMSKFALEFLDTVIEFDVTKVELSLVQEILDFFKDYFTISSTYSKSDVILVFHSYSDFDKEKFYSLSTSFITIRKSSAGPFNFTGDKAEINGIEIINSSDTCTAFEIDLERRTANIYISEDSRIQVIDFIRDLVIKKEEYNGSLILHASGVVSNQCGIAIVGSKGAGKSTLMLDLMGKGGFQYLSGDKLILRIEENNIKAYGWPDYPHVGIGTIIGHKNLVDALEGIGHKIDMATPQKKILFPQSVLKEAIGFSIVKGPVLLKKIIFPNVRMEKAVSIEALSKDSMSRVLEHLEFSVDNIFSKWHRLLKSEQKENLVSYVNKLSILLKDCSYYTIEGKGELSEIQLEVLKC